MSTKSDPGFVRIKDKIPYHGKGADELVAAIRKILTDHKYTQRFVCEVGTPHIAIEELVPEQAAVDLPKPLTLHDAIRLAKMEEFEMTPGMPSINVLFHMFDVVHEEDLEVCGIAVGNKKRFEKWLGIKLSNRKMEFFETPVHIVGELPEDVFIICGAKERIADFDEILFSLKVAF